MAKRNLSKKPKRKQLSRKLKRKTLNRKKRGGDLQNMTDRKLVFTSNDQDSLTLKDWFIGILLFVIFIMLHSLKKNNNNNPDTNSNSEGNNDGDTNSNGGGNNDNPIQELPIELISCVNDNFKEHFKSFMKKCFINQDGSRLQIVFVSPDQSLIDSIKNDVVLKNYIKKPTIRNGEKLYIAFEIPTLDNMNQSDKYRTTIFTPLFNRISSLDNNSEIINTTLIDEYLAEIFR